MQEDIAQSQKEQEYNLPKLKKKVTEDKNSGSKADEEQLEGQQHSHLLCECFLCISV